MPTCPACQAQALVLSLDETRYICRLCKRSFEAYDRIHYTDDFIAGKPSRSQRSQMRRITQSFTNKKQTKKAALAHLSQEGIVNEMRRLVSLFRRKRCGVASIDNYIRQVFSIANVSAALERAVQSVRNVDVAFNEAMAKRIHFLRKKSHSRFPLNILAQQMELLPKFLGNFIERREDFKIYNYATLANSFDCISAVYMHSIDFIEFSHVECQVGFVLMQHITNPDASYLVREFIRVFRFYGLKKYILFSRDLNQCSNATSPTHMAVVASITAFFLLFHNGGGFDAKIRFKSYYSTRESMRRYLAEDLPAEKLARIKEKFPAFDMPPNALHVRHAVLECKRVNIYDFYSAIGNFSPISYHNFFAIAGFLSKIFAINAGVQDIAKLMR